MKKSTLSAAVGLTLGLANFAAQAALTSSSVLQFNMGTTVCVNNDCTNFGTDVTAGSWFGMDANGNSIISAGEKTAIGSHDGIHIGFTSTATGSHSGNPFGVGNSYTGTNLQQVAAQPNGTPVYQTTTNMDTNGKPIVVGTDTNGKNIYQTTGTLVTYTTTEHPGVDEPWGFFGNTGMDFINGTPVTVLKDDGSKKWLDFSGWTVTWNGIPSIPMTTGAWGTGTNFYTGGNSVARILCSSSTCSTSSTYTLDYFATVPLGDPSGFGGVKYTLHLEGHVGAAAVVPVPAAVWLFGSGLVGMAAVARRKKKA